MTAAGGPWSWWLVINRYGGMSRTRARSEVEARGNVREGIAESFRGEGLSESAARRAGQTYRLVVIAGGCTAEEASAAREAWDQRDHGPAWALHVRWRESVGRKPWPGLQVPA